VGEYGENILNAICYKIFAGICFCRDFRPSRFWAILHYQAWVFVEKKYPGFSFSTKKYRKC